MFTVWFEAHLAIVLGVALCVVAAIVILQQRRTPQSTAAWLLFIFLAPYLALPIFLALGFRKSGTHFTAVRFHTAGVVSVPVTDVDSMFAHYGIPPSMGDNTFRLIEDGADCWDEVLTLVNSASKTLDVSYYLIANDVVGARFVEALTERVRAGVRVRLIIDRLGGFLAPDPGFGGVPAGGRHAARFLSAHTAAGSWTSQPAQSSQDDHLGRGARHVRRPQHRGRLPRAGQG